MEPAPGSKSMHNEDAIDLVIFDCDGVLVDSEALGNRVIIELGGEFGLRMMLDEAMRVFRGGKMADCIAEIERRIKGPLPATFEMTLRERMKSAFLRELTAVEGVLDALDRIRTPICVASNGPLEKMRVTLQVTGLADRFAGRIFSAYEVNSWKPEPGLFLHAARTLGARPSRCVVVEDSLHGVSAAVAAGMRVLGFVPPSHGDEEPLRAAGAETFSCMSQLPALLDGAAVRRT